VETVDASKAEVAVNGNPATFKLNTGAYGTVVSDKIIWLSTILLHTTGVHLYGSEGKHLQA